MSEGNVVKHQKCQSPLFLTCRMFGVPQRLIEWIDLSWNNLFSFLQNNICGREVGHNTCKTIHTHNEYCTILSCECIASVQNIGQWELLIHIAGCSQRFV